VKKVILITLATYLYVVIGIELYRSGINMEWPDGENSFKLAAKYLYFAFAFSWSSGLLLIGSLPILFPNGGRRDETN